MPFPEIRTIKNDFNMPIKAIVNPKFNQTYGIAMVNFGSIDTFNGVPAGSAHFLEHKLFAKPNGDSSDYYAKYGGDSNAFTSYTKTAYLFKTIKNSAQNLNVLLNLISEPYFTNANVEKEKGIIGQEIQMYADMPDSVIERKTLQNLYPQEAIGNDIAGSEQTISVINPESLTKIYNKYYAPKNFTLYLAGNINVEQIEDDLSKLTTDTNIKQFINKTSESELNDLTVHHAVVPTSKFKFKTQRPRMMLGLRFETKELNKSGLIDFQNKLNIFMDVILGDSSKIHQRLFSKDLIDDSFGFNVVIERHYAFVLISAETNSPQKLADIIEDYLFNHKYDVEFTEENLEASKKDSIGTYLFAQDYLENFATEAAELSFYGLSVKDLPAMIASVSLNDLQSISNEKIEHNNFTKTYMYPEE